MDSPHVYDKAKYHAETVEKYGLPGEHAENHALVILRWLIEHDLMNDWFVEDSGDTLRRFRDGQASIHDVYAYWDFCLVNDMLSEEGNAFAMHYFDFESGRYIHDYIELLQGDFPSEYHVRYTEDNYQRIRQLIDRRYEEWKNRQTKPKRRWWRPF